MLCNNSEKAKAINAIRWRFIEHEKLAAPQRVLDYGSGAGFFKAFAPETVEVDTYDIAEARITTGIRHRAYKVVTMWDVLEHITPNQLDHLIEMAINAAEYVAVSVPILPSGQNLFTWKHYKLEEHVNLFTEESLSDIFNDWGFELVKSGYPECACGIRQDIYSAMYKRK